MTDAEILRAIAADIRRSVATGGEELSHRSGATHHAEFYAQEAARRYETAADEAERRAAEAA